MTALALLLVTMFAPPLVVTTLDSIRADANAERRARSAIDFAAAAERRAEAAYDSDESGTVARVVADMVTAVELAHSSLIASGKDPIRSPGSFKYAEQRSHDILLRLADLQRKMDSTERPSLDQAIARTQEIHDEWLEGLMEKKKK